MEVYLIRHTTPLIEKGICYGQSDIALAESFRSEASQLLQQIPEEIDAVYSSSSSRCYKLARLVKSDQLIIDNRLLELNFGDWEMKNWDEINKEDLDKWMKDFVNVRVSNGENFIDLSNRVNNFIDDLTLRNYKKVVIVSHAGVIRSFMSKVYEKPLEKAFEIKVEYSSIIKITINR